MSSKIKNILAEKIIKHQRELSEWYLENARTANPPFYCSVDLRDSGHKIVPVDSNLFPAGFNNICPEDIRTAPNVVRAQLEAHFIRSGRSGVPERILIIPESHTTNTFYLENLFYLISIIRGAGFEARLGWYGPVPDGVSVPIQLKTATGKELEAHPISIVAGVVSIEGYVPDVILLNNDFSGGYPEPLDAVTQPILPSYMLGWHTRKKSEHFRYYNRLAAEFARIIDIDPWTIQIETEEVSQVDFNEDQGIEEVARSVERILEHTKAAYEKHAVKHRPFVYVKNNSGTYGMGIMVVHSADELRTMNRRTKNKMSVGKNRMPIHSVAVQEGVPTATTVDRLPAEPVIYLMGTDLIGGFLRANSERDEEGNLNSPGMVFKMLCMSDLRNLESDPTDPELKGAPILEIIYGAVARLSALATGMELAAHQQRSGAGAQV